MKILALDIASTTGYALLSDPDTLLEYGTFQVEPNDFEYPNNYIAKAESLGKQVLQYLYKSMDNDIHVVIEETNPSRKSGRYVQKMLEWMHYCVLKQLQTVGLTPTYVNTKDWRRICQIQLSAEQKKLNSKLAKAKREAKKSGKPLDKKKLGIKGKITTKHLSVDFTNQKFGLNLKKKDDDIGDAVSLGHAGFKLIKEENVR